MEALGPNGRLRGTKNLLPLDLLVECFAQSVRRSTYNAARHTCIALWAMPLGARFLEEELVLVVRMVEERRRKVVREVRESYLRLAKAR